ncbi:hypothetical protein Tco_1505904 [Tanacetum coccineum]
MKMVQVDGNQQDGVLFRACLYADGIAKNVEAANAILEAYINIYRRVQRYSAECRCCPTAHVLSVAILIFLVWLRRFFVTFTFAFQLGQSKIEQWINFSSFKIDTNLRGWILPRLGYANYIKPVSYFFLSVDISFVFNIGAADSLMLTISSISKVSSAMSFSRFFFSVTLIASSSYKSSSTKGDVLEGGGVSSNVTLMDVVFDGAFRGVGDEEVVVGEGVVVTSSSLEMLTNNCLGGIMVNLIFLEGLKKKHLWNSWYSLVEEDEDDKENRRSLDEIVVNCIENQVRSRGSDFEIPVVFSLSIALLRNKMVTTRRNSDDDVPNFEAMITATVANALPNLTTALRTQITNDTRNGAGPSGGGGGDAIPQEIHVWIERFTKLKPFAFRSAATPAEIED